MKVEISAPAAADLEDIADWIAQDDWRRAESFVANLVERVMSLSENPRRFPEVGVGAIRKLSWRGYVILYSVAKDRVDVLRVVQASRDWATLL
ncbi:MAG: type II toxin-antitoxin system RelE/ParE family toxin [Allosphingosinicella sp.]